MITLFFYFFFIFYRKQFICPYSSKGSCLELQAGNWADSQSCPQDFQTRPHLLNLPKHCHQLRTKTLNAWANVGPFIRITTTLGIFVCFEIGSQNLNLFQYKWLYHNWLVKSHLLSMWPCWHSSSKVYWISVLQPSVIKELPKVYHS